MKGEIGLQRFFQFIAICSVAVTLIVALGAWLSGRLSLACLRRAPDFPHRTEMIWGAKWGWAVLSGLIGVMSLVSWLAANFGFYPTSLLAAAATVLYVGFSFYCHFFRWQNAGAGGWILVAVNRIRGRAMDWQAYVAWRQRKVRPELRPLHVVIVLTLIFGAAGWYISRNFPTEHLARQIWAAVDSHNVVRVLPISPYFRPLGRPIYGGSIQVFVRPETPEAEMRHILRTTREMMKEADLRVHWLLLVYAAPRKSGAQSWDHRQREWSNEQWSWPDSGNE